MAFCDFHYFSPALGKQTAAYVLTPEIGTGPFPVMYLLHGLSDDHTIWLRRTRLEEFLVNIPLIVVMPDGGRGFYCDAEQGYAYDKALAVELVDRIDRTFPTKAERESRCVAGLSMGGYGAAKFALAHPDRFAAGVSHSGALAFAHKPQTWDEARAKEWGRIVGTEPNGPNDLFALTEKADKATLPALRIDCGTEDFLIDDNRAFHAHLEKLGIAHEYQENPGAHNWAYWDTHIQDTLAFFRKTMGF